MILYCVQVLNRYEIGRFVAYQTLFFNVETSGYMKCCSANMGNKSMVFVLYDVFINIVIYHCLPDVFMFCRYYRY